jgi:ABC-type nickel/cobalt efflux system permease component RcnA
MTIRQMTIGNSCAIHKYVAPLIWCNMNKNLTMLAIMSAIIATGLAMTTLSATPVFAANSAAVAGSTNGAASGAAYADFFDTSSAAGAGNVVTCTANFTPIHGATCTARPS